MVSIKVLFILSMSSLCLLRNKYASDTITDGGIQQWTQRWVKQSPCPSISCISVWVWQKGSIQIQVIMPDGDRYHEEKES